MTLETASCTYHGDTFSCTFSVAGSGPDEEVRILYHDELLTAKTAGLPALKVAETLLNEAVALEAIAIKVAQATPGKQAQNHSDAWERRLVA